MPESFVDSSRDEIAASRSRFLFRLDTEHPVHKPFAFAVVEVELNGRKICFR